MIEYRINKVLDPKRVIEVFESSGIHRPVHDLKRISKMFAEANLVISAWNNDELVGVSRSLTDYSYCCYLSDLAVKKEYQNSGIGRMLIQKTQDIIGDQVTLLLLSAPDAMEYYPKIGMQKVENAFAIRRKR